MPKEFDLSRMSETDLKELIRRIEELLPLTAEREWKEQATRLEVEALEAVEALREFSGRKYELTLSGYVVQRRNHTPK